MKNGFNYSNYVMQSREQIFNSSAAQNEGQHKLVDVTQAPNKKHRSTTWKSTIVNQTDEK